MPKRRMKATPTNAPLHGRVAGREGGEMGEKGGKRAKAAGRVCVAGGWVYG